MCELYWRLLEVGLEVTCGVWGYLRALGCIDEDCPCDVAVYRGDLHRVGDHRCVVPVDRPGFSNRAVLIGGCPHLAPEDLRHAELPPRAARCLARLLTGP